MSDESYYLQKAVYERLVGTPALIALVPASAIADAFGGVPAVFPSILLGEAQIVDDSHDTAGKVVTVYLTLHLWTKESALNAVKKIGNEVRHAVNSAGLQLGGGYQAGRCRAAGVRYIRDPKGENGHGVVTIEAIVGAT